MLTRPARRDPNEREIREALEQSGAAVIQVDGKDLPDLLVAYRGRWIWLEVKRPAGPKGGKSQDGQKLSAGQAEFFLVAHKHQAPAHVVRTVREAYEACGMFDTVL